jgi:hypothetical protein
VQQSETTGSVSESNERDSRIRVVGDDVPTASRRIELTEFSISRGLKPSTLVFAPANIAAGDVVANARLAAMLLKRVNVVSIIECLNRRRQHLNSA